MHTCIHAHTHEHIYIYSLTLTCAHMRAHAHERVLHSSIFPIKALDVRKRAYNIRNSPGALYTSNNSLHKESHVSETEKQCVMGHMRLLVDVLKKPWMSAKEPVLTAIALELSNSDPHFCQRVCHRVLRVWNRAQKRTPHCHTVTCVPNRVQSLPKSLLCPKQGTKMDTLSWLFPPVLLFICKSLLQ